MSFFTSCGTSLNLKNVGHVSDAGKSLPFGGIYLDVKYGNKKPALYLDMPFSLIADVITLPYTLYITLFNRENEASVE